MLPPKKQSSLHCEVAKEQAMAPKKLAGLAGMQVAPVGYIWGFPWGYPKLASDGFFHGQSI